jgi:LAGLIDADG endonuclease
MKSTLQIPLDKAYYIAGFADGEGSFNTSFRQRSDYLLGWKITPVFNISQKERTILALIKRHLKCGTIRYRKDGVWAYEVETRAALRDTIIPFFNTFRFLSEKKKADFQRFQRILAILDKHRSTTYADLERILVLLDDVECKAAHIYSRHQILERATMFWERNRRKIEMINAVPVDT